jgi:hypothetical protein
VIDPYRSAHKAIRASLGRLLESAGRTDFGDPTSIDRFRAELETAVELLTTHARIEVQFIDVLLAAHDPLHASHIQHQHVDLDRELLAVMGGLHRIDEELGPDDDGDRENARVQGHRFYLALSRFVARYFLHIADEEERALPLLRSHVSEDALRDALARARATIPPDELARTTALVRESISDPEREAM